MPAIVSGMSRKQRQSKSRKSSPATGDLNNVELPPLAHAIAQVAILAGVAGEVAALLTGNTKFLVAGMDGCATLTGTATSAAHDESKESKSWEDGKKVRPEFSDRIETIATVSQDGEQSLLMKQMGERLLATRQRRRQKKE